MKNNSSQCVAGFNFFLSVNNNCLRKSAIILFVVSLVVRLSILALFDNNRIHPDGTGYHQMAVNLVKGNGLSLQENEPFERSFFREPGYPTFLACVYFVVNQFVDVNYIQSYDIATKKLDHYHPEIVAAKIVQSVIDSISVVLIFIIVTHLADLKLATLTGLVSAIFVNLAYHSIFILRESLVMFLLLVLNFLYIKFLRGTKPALWSLLMGIMLGVLILVFQIHFVVIPVLFALTYWNTKKFWRSVCYTSLSAIVAIMITIPHCVCAYRFYPDIRVFKTFGTSLTYEQNAYTTAILKAKDYGILTDKEVHKLVDWDKGSKEQFEKSFNGYYADETRKLNALVQEHSLSKRKLLIYVEDLRRSLFLTNLGYGNVRDLVHMYGVVILIPLFFVPGMIGFFGVCGLLFAGGKKILCLPTVVTYALLFWILGSEYRRMIILQPFLIFFGLAFLEKVYGSIKGKLVHARC